MTSVILCTVRAKGSNWYVPKSSSLYRLIVHINIIDCLQLGTHFKGKWTKENLGVWLSQGKYNMWLGANSHLSDLRCLFNNCASLPHISAGTGSLWSQTHPQIVYCHKSNFSSLSDKPRSRHILLYLELYYFSS